MTDGVYIERLGNSPMLEAIVHQGLEVVEDGKTHFAKFPDGKHCAMRSVGSYRSDRFEVPLAALDFLVGNGYLKRDGKRYVVTEKGRIMGGAKRRA